MPLAPGYLFSASEKGFFRSFGDPALVSISSGSQVPVSATAPHEVHNIADDPRYENILVELRAALDQWVVETGDKGEVPESEEVTKYWDENAHKQYVEKMESRGFNADFSSEEYLAWWEKRLGKIHKEQ